MVAHFYLMAESFSHNEQYDSSEIEEKVKRLSEDVILINRHKASNLLYTNYTEIYPQIFYKTHTVEDFICNPIELRKSGVDRDVINSLQNILNKSQSTSFTSNEVLEELIYWNDEKDCHGLIAFHNIDTIPESVQLVYGLDSWYKFRRYFLGLYPNVDTFIDECSVYYPNLFFHENNKSSIKKIVKDFSRSITYHLEVLNDVFYTYKEREFENESIKYQTLTSECNLEADAASKDDNSAKEKLQYTFIDNTNTNKKVACYPHLRLCKSDIKSDSRYYHHRIYFHEGLESIQNNKILIGHIGLHRN